MKIKKMAGALALTAALAMGSVPAFATDNVDDDGSANEFSDNGSTTIKAKVDKYDENIRAIVPLSLTVAFGSNQGGNDFTAPTPGAYKITNIGKGDIVLKDAELTMLTDDDGDYPFTSTAFCLNENAFAGSVKYQTYDSNLETWSALPAGYHMCLSFNAGEFNTYLTADHPISKAGTSYAVEKRYVAGATNGWTDILIPKGEEGAAERELAIQLGGAGYFENAIDKDKVTDTDLCQITYTIAAAPSASAGE